MGKIEKVILFVLYFGSVLYFIGSALWHVAKLTA